MPDFVKTNSCLVVANGPSSCLVDFGVILDRYHAVNAMNASYRLWINSSFRPTHYCALDNVLTRSLASDIRNIIDEGIVKKFFLEDVFLEEFPQYANHPKILTLNQAKIRFSKNGNATLPITTGTWAIRWMIDEGYSEIDIVGMDGVRIERVDNSDNDSSNKFINDGLKIVKTPKYNPNYFFSGYQQEGDKYRIPNSVGHYTKNHIKLHDHALMALVNDVQEKFSYVKLRDCSVNSFHQILPKTGFRSDYIKKSKSDFLNVFGELDFSDSKEIFNALSGVYGELVNSDWLRRDGWMSVFFGSPICADSRGKGKNLRYYIGLSVLNNRIYSDRPTIIIVIREYALVSKLTQAGIDNAIRCGAVLEWELYDSPNLDFINAVNLLGFYGDLKNRLLNYNWQIFCNFSDVEGGGRILLI